MSPAKKPLAVDPRTTAVVIVECQNGVVGKGSVLPNIAEAAAETLPVIARLVKEARAAGARIVHLTYVPVADNRSSNRKPRLFGQILDLMDDWNADHPATKVVDEIGVQPGDVILPRHQGLSPTHGTETFKILRNLGVTTLVMAGVSTNIAIPVASTEAADEGFDVLIPTDAVIGSPPEHHRSMIKYTLSFIATLTTTDELVDQWRPH